MIEEFGEDDPVACYQKNGFVIEQVIDIPLGGGLVNQDFVMRKKYE